MAGLVDFSDGELVGSMAEPYDCIFDHSRVPVEYVSVSLKRGLYYLERGELDALIPLARTAERDESLIFGGELISADYSYVSFKPLDQLLDRDNLRFVIVRGFVGGIFIPKTAVRVEEVNTWGQLGPMLERDRADVTVVPTQLIEKVFRERTAKVYVKPAGMLAVSLYISPLHKGSAVTERITSSVENCRPELSVIGRG